MAKLTVTVTVLLFTLALSVVSSKSENDNLADNPSTLSAEPDPDTTIPTLSGSGSGPELTSSDEITVPVNFMNFHPINRHFPRRPLTTALFNRRPCHQIAYGDDMIFSGEEKPTGTDLLSDGVVSDIKVLVHPFASEKTKHHPGHYVVRLEIDNPGEVEAEEDGSRKIMVKLIRRKEDERDNYKSMFTRKIRKFLNHLV